MNVVIHIVITLMFFLQLVMLTIFMSGIFDSNGSVRIHDYFSCYFLFVCYVRLLHIGDIFGVNVEG